VVVIVVAGATSHLRAGLLPQVEERHTQAEDKVVSASLAPRVV
jgi:hypothetical protein